MPSLPRALLLLPLLLLWIFYSQDRSSQYTVLGVSRNSTKQEIRAAYQSLSENGKQTEKVHHAFNVLYNDLSRRDYDNFDLDYEPQTTETGPIASSTQELTLENFGAALEDNTPLLVQIYSTASIRCREFSPVWERLAEDLDGLVNLRRVELGDVQLAKLFAENKFASSRRSTVRNGVPAIVAIPPGCKEASCIWRYSSKDLTYDAILDWVSARVLNLPRILYYSAQTLVPEMIAKSGSHKVKALLFSETGLRAAPYMRQVAKDFADYATFGCILWRESESSIWKSRLGVESAPALVLLRDPGVVPLVVHGRMNRTMFMHVIEEHKTHVLPQLRSVTARSLGCDVTGHSTGNFSTWYCVVAAGKPGHNLNQLRSTMRLVKDDLDSEETEASFEHAAVAYKQNRLALTWLDGEAQKKFCHYFLASEKVYETCGARQYAEEPDVPRVFLIRFQKAPEEQSLPSNRPARPWTASFWSQEDENNLPSILVARYNGTIDEASELASWISKTLESGEKDDIPTFKVSSAPVLVPEDAPPRLASTREYVSQSKSRASDKLSSFMQGASDMRKDFKLWTAVVLIVSVIATQWWFR